LQLNAVRAVTAVYLLLPQIPILFMGEEFGTSNAFPSSRDFEPELAEAVRERRRGKFARFSFGRWIAAALRYEPCDRRRPLVAETPWSQHLVGKLRWFVNGRLERILDDQRSGHEWK
jgi:maltooligosyltrehalose trehalohydrolase